MVNFIDALAEEGTKVSAELSASDQQKVLLLADKFADTVAEFFGKNENLLSKEEYFIAQLAAMSTVYAAITTRETKHG